MFPATLPSSAARERRPPRVGHPGRGTHLLARAGRVLAGSLDFAETVSNLTGLAVPALADWCLVDVPGDDGRPQPVEVAAADSAHTAALRQLLPSLRSSAGAHTDAVAEVLATGRPRLLAGLLPRAAEGEGPLAPVRAPAPRVALVIPLTAGDTVVGALTLARMGRRRFGAAEMAAAEELGVLGGLAMHNAALYAQAQRATRMRDEVLGVVAHDLRNPLMAISMYAHVLHESGLTGSQAEWVDVVLRNTERMNGLIQDLLDFTALDAGRLRVRPAPCAVGPLLSEALQLLEPQARAAGVRLSVRRGGEVPAVFADRDRVLQVLSNLLGNAVKFTPAGGGVELAAETHGAEVEFTVRDDGPGIAAGDLPHVFERFWQGAGTRRGSAGLGLAITRGIVESHGGRIRVESVPGAGSTFSFTLPATDLLPARPAGVPVAAAPAEGETVRVLLVDDHPPILRGLRALLGHSPGVAVAGEAESADEAVIRAAALHPDVVLMDLNLPGGGLDATRRIVAGCPSARVLILTAEPDDRCVAAALHAGASGYLRKSADPAALLNALRAVRRGERVLDVGLQGWAAEPADGPADLDEDAIRVLKLHACGFGTPDIAARLGMRVRAAGRLRTRSMRALGLSTRAELVRYALRHGWLGSDGCPPGMLEPAAAPPGGGAERRAAPPAAPAAPRPSGRKG